MSIRIENEDGVLSADRKIGIPLITINVTLHKNTYGEQLSEHDRMLASFKTKTIGISPDEAEKLGNALISLAKDCKEHPDRRKK